MDLIKLSYFGGSDAALADFGLSKEAMDPETFARLDPAKQKIMMAHASRGTGLQAVQGAGGPGAPQTVPQQSAGFAPQQVGGPGMAAPPARSVPLETTNPQQGSGAGVVGGPGMAQGFGGGAVPLHTAPKVQPPPGVGMMPQAQASRGLPARLP